MIDDAPHWASFSSAFSIVLSLASVSACVLLMLMDTSF
jgi:hypothetical protein